MEGWRGIVGGGGGGKGADERAEESRGGKMTVWPARLKLLRLHIQSCDLKFTSSTLPRAAQSVIQLVPPSLVPPQAAVQL